MYSIPFVPVSDPTIAAYSQIDTSQYFDEFTSNEVQQAVTNPDGTGQLQFETLTSTEAPGLGCGQQESNGQVRNCWLVVLPRGQYEPNGFKINAQSAGQLGYLWSSPLSASNWAMRIQIHLAYAPVGTFCPIGTQEVQTIGTQVVARAVQSWQLALNKAANCTRVYGYSAVPEATSTQQLALSGSPAGMAFTTIPIAARPRALGSGGTVRLPPILYAPVAVRPLASASISTTALTTSARRSSFTPGLLAKGVTQVYRTDCQTSTRRRRPPGTMVGVKPRQHVQGSAVREAQSQYAVSPPVSLAAPLLTEDHSVLDRRIRRCALCCRIPRPPAHGSATARRMQRTR